MQSASSPAAAIGGITGHAYFSDRSDHSGIIVSAEPKDGVIAATAAAVAGNATMTLTHPTLKAKGRVDPPGSSGADQVSGRESDDPVHK